MLLFAAGLFVQHGARRRMEVFDVQSEKWINHKFATTTASLKACQGKCMTASTCCGFNFEAASGVCEMKSDCMRTVSSPARPLPPPVHPPTSRAPTPLRTPGPMKSPTRSPIPDPTVAPTPAPTACGGMSLSEPTLFANSYRAVDFKDAKYLSFPAFAEIR